MRALYAMDERTLLVSVSLAGWLVVTMDQRTNVHTGTLIRTFIRSLHAHMHATCARTGTDRPTKRRRS